MNLQDVRVLSQVFAVAEVLYQTESESKISVYVCHKEGRVLVGVIVAKAKTYRLYSCHEYSLCTFTTMPFPLSSFPPFLILIPPNLTRSHTNTYIYIYTYTLLYYILCYIVEYGCIYIFTMYILSLGFIFVMHKHSCVLSPCSFLIFDSLNWNR